MRESFVIVAASALLAAAAAAADHVRCGNRLASSGDTREAVRQKCGEPAEIARRSLLRRPSYIANGRQYFLGEELVEVPVELWTYNFGPNKFMRRLRFVDGVLEDIETLGYGYREQR